VVFLEKVILQYGDILCGVACTMLGKQGMWW
jgi:hypothetical protein